MTDDFSGYHTCQGFFVADNFAQFSVPFLSLNQTEGEELLLISKEFPPPPEGEIVDVCDGNPLKVGNFYSASISLTSIAIFSGASACKCLLNEW